MGQSETVQIMALNCLWAYSGACVRLEKWGVHFYDTNYVIRSCVNEYVWVIEQFDILLDRRKREPNADYWVNVCTLNNIANAKPSFFESYELITRPLTEELKQSFVNAFTHISPNGTNDNIIQNGTDSIVVLKMMNKYKIALCSAKNVDPNKTPTMLTTDDIVAVPSRYYLLSASYSHPDMNKSIQLKVPKEMFMTGNQLFSPAFVCRTLFYQEKPFVFDMNYTIHIIDKDVNQITLSSKQFLQIGEMNSTVKDHIL